MPQNSDILNFEEIHPNKTQQQISVIQEQDSNLMNDSKNGQILDQSTDNNWAGQAMKKPGSVSHKVNFIALNRNKIKSNQERSLDSCTKQNV